MTPNLIITTADLGTLRVRYDDEWEHGTTAYEVQGPRVAGVFTVGIDARPVGLDVDPDSEVLQVHFGRRNPDEGRLWWIKGRPDVPSVNGVQLFGGARVDLATLRSKPFSSGRDLRGDVYRADPFTVASAATARRTALIVEALGRHWLGRPENYALRLHAAHAAVPSALADQHQALHEATEALTAAQARVAEVAASIERAQMFEDITSWPYAEAS